LGGWDARRMVGWGSGHSDQVSAEGVFKLQKKGGVVGHIWVSGGARDWFFQAPHRGAPADLNLLARRNLPQHPARRYRSDVSHRNFPRGGWPRRKHEGGRAAQGKEGTEAQKGLASSHSRPTTTLGGGAKTIARYGRQRLAGRATCWVPYGLTRMFGREDCAPGGTGGVVQAPAAGD